MWRFNFIGYNKTHLRSSCRVPGIFCSIVTKSGSCWHIVITSPIPSITEIRSVGIALIHAARRADMKLKGVSRVRLVGLHKTTQNEDEGHTAQDLLHLGPPEYKD